MLTTINRVIPLQNEKVISRRTRVAISLLSTILFFYTPVQATETQNWSDKQATLSIEEYLDLLFATRFQNLNPTEPMVVDFVPNKSSQEALIFIVRPVVTPDFDLTDQTAQKKDILNQFRNNVSKQADEHLAFTRKLLADPSVAKRWAGANVEQNFAIRFVKADNVRQTVAVMSKGKTIFEKDELDAARALIKPRAGELWVE